MARTVNPVLISNTSETFATWIAKTNNMIDYLATVIVTTALTSNGDITSGNAFVSGIFGANTLVCTNLRAGNVASNAASITLQSNVVANSGVVMTLNETYVGNSMHFAYTSTTSNTLANQVLQSFPTATWRGGKFVISVKNNNANAHQMTEILVLQDGSATQVTEYATLASNGSVGTFSANVSGGNINLLYSPSSSNTQVTVSGTLIRV